MKTSLLLVIILFISVNMFPQAIKIFKNDGSGSESIIISKIDSIKFLPFQCGVDQVSYAGKNYNTVLIGTQCWLKENLDIGTRINGSVNQTNNSTIEKYCYNDDPANCTTYGGLYQWAEAVAYTNGSTNYTYSYPPLTGNVQGICPNGWHIPTYAELQTLVTTVSNNSNALKAVGQGTGDGSGTNTSGFSTLLAGGRGFSSYYGLGDIAQFWSSKEYTGEVAYIMYLKSYDSYIDFYICVKVSGSSVRCIKN